MATTSNIIVKTLPYKLTMIVDYPKKASEVIAQGDLLEDNGSGAEAVDGATNNAFIGVAMTGSTATDTGPVSVMIRGVVRAKIAAASAAAGSYGKAFKYSAGANGTDWELTSATAEGIMWALEVISKGSYGNFLVDVPAIESGKFETVT